MKLWVTGSHHLLRTICDEGKQRNPMLKILISFLVGLYFLSSGIAAAASLEVQKVADGVYALVGDLGQRSPQNLGNNATFGVVVTSDGVVLVDPGGTRKGAEQIDAAIQSLTDKQVVLVINTGGQDQRWLGNGYFKARGAGIIASSAAVEDQKERTNDQLTTSEALVGKDGFAGTEPFFADETFDDQLELTIGGVRLQLFYPGAAHTPGDSIVWLPEKRIAFSGDIVYVERLLSLSAVSHLGEWIASFEALARLDPILVIPGHGRATTLAKARADTYDYLVNLRDRVKAVLERGGPIAEGIAVDQSAFSHLANFDQLARRNAQQAYMELEFE
jgi:glyoxylase-like metal-dependent hydrolase (beta-lactamase superfamily II)